MVTVRFIQHDGTVRVVEGNEGDSVMQTARDKLVVGIIGECGGNCFCGTCHAYVDPAWLGRLPAKSEMEETLLSGVVHLQDDSRLTCQIELQPGLDGLVLRIPASQL
jgi:2Fe-2S ferredoxin